MSRYRVLKTDGITSVLALTPVTGRTHQLRLHCKMAGFPILGDPQYASPASMLFSCARGLFTQQLCAAKLELPHPVTGQPLIISTRKAVSTGDEQLHFDALLAQHDARVV